MFLGNCTLWLLMWLWLILLFGGSPQLFLCLHSLCCPFWFTVSPTKLYASQGYSYLSIFIPGTLYVQAFSRAALEEWLPSVKEIMRSKAAHEARKQGGFVALNHLESSTWSSRCWNTWLWCLCLFCSWLFMTEQLGVSSTIAILKMDVAEDCIPQSPFHPFPKTPPVWGSIWSMLVLSV
jgi:hypothetical protein